MVDLISSSDSTSPPSPTITTAYDLNLSATATATATGMATATTTPTAITTTTTTTATITVVSTTPEPKRRKIDVDLSQTSPESSTSKDKIHQRGKKKKDKKDHNYEDDNHPNHNDNDDANNDDDDDDDNNNNNDDRDVTMSPSSSSPSASLNRTKDYINVSDESDMSIMPNPSPTLSMSSSSKSLSSSTLSSFNDRVPRKAKTEAHQRVAAMAQSLMDDSEVYHRNNNRRKRSYHSTYGAAAASPSATSSSYVTSAAAAAAAASSSSSSPLSGTTPTRWAAAKSASSSSTSSTSSSNRTRQQKRISPSNNKSQSIQYNQSSDDDDGVQILEVEEADVEEDGMDADVNEVVIEDDSDDTVQRSIIGKRASSSRAAAQAATKNFARKSTTQRAAIQSSLSSSSSSSSSSGSSSSSSSSSSSTISKKARDLRRDKRASGFGAWKAVHKLSIPAMTYEGYEDLARQCLESQTQDAIRTSQPYSPQGTDAYHRDPSSIISGKAEIPLTLMRRVDTKYGREEYKVQASRTIEKKEVVAFLGGRLIEQVKANKEMREEWSQHFHLKKEWLKEFFEYNGHHDLVVSTKDHRCIASYIRGPENRTDGVIGANLKADVWFDSKTGLFVVIYYALERIRRGCEVFCMPFLGDWQDRCHREMFLYSRISHWYHKWAKRLEENLISLGIEFDQSVPAHMRAVILTADQEEKFLAIPGMDQGVLPQPLPMDESMKLIDVHEAMEYSNCKYSAKAIQKDLSPETQHCIEGQLNNRHT